MEQVRRAAQRVAQRIVCDAHEAEDIAQEAVLRLVRAQHAGAAIRNEVAFAVQTAARLAADRRRSKARGVVAIPDVPGPPPNEIEPEDVGRLYAAIERLPEMQRAVVVLRMLLEWEYREVGELLGAPEATCRSHCRFGLRRLRELLMEGA